ncbi:unnamed protein product [Rotaria magnacalcarata]|uniref:Uncharacterized protein n=2 Tax=Rotaria magnacalcarata TaxID=392030 RepID=A0A816Y4D2_9BILA|nr:unnamed protein product [Rotaria magnacalcarata]CAF2154584.1 unnamed protein product [Rotaria magnacalcarata]CAF3835002.1 unnamed protein product [Rotaria magnacalcarata]
MGSVIHRSLAERDVIRKRKKQRHNLDFAYEPDVVATQNSYEGDDRNDDFIKTYEVWNKTFDEKPLMNANDDPPGAPNMYSSNHSIIHNDLTNQIWKLSHQVNNSFYPMNSLSSTSSYNIPYVSTQNIRTELPTMISNQSQNMMFNESLSKKEQYALKSLANTQSCHLPSNTTDDMRLSTKKIKPVRLSNHAPVSETKTVVSNISIGKPPAKKAIYLSIDHQATLAERCQSVANEQHRRNLEYNYMNGLNSSTNSCQTHPYINYQYQNVNDSSNMNIYTTSNKSFDLLQNKLSGTNHRREHSSSTNKLVQDIADASLIHNEISRSRPKSNHRAQSSTNRRIRSSKSRENHQHNKQEHVETVSNELHLPKEYSIRRIDNKTSNISTKRVLASSNHRQHQT